MRGYNDIHPLVAGVSTKSSELGLKSGRGQTDTPNMS
jgi:hypothetical protein